MVLSASQECAALNKAQVISDHQRAVSGALWDKKNVKDVQADGSPDSFVHLRQGTNVGFKKTLGFTRIVLASAVAQGCVLCAEATRSGPLLGPAPGPMPAAPPPLSPGGGTNHTDTIIISVVLSCGLVALLGGAVYRYRV